MLDARKLLDQLIGNGAAGGFAGGLAYKAWQNHKQGVTAPAGTVSTSPVSAPTADLQQGAGFLPRPGDEAGTQQLSQLIVRAMISAAKADGQVDTRESGMILQQVNDLPLDDEAKAFLFAEYSKPLDIEGLVAAVDSPEHAAEVYAASALVVHPASPAEQFYLDSLARGLRLESGLLRQLESVVASSTTA